MPSKTPELAIVVGPTGLFSCPTLADNDCLVGGLGVASRNGDSGGGELVPVWRISDFDMSLWLVLIVQQKVESSYMF